MLPPTFTTSGAKHTHYQNRYAIFNFRTISSCSQLRQSSKAAGAKSLVDLQLVIFENCEPKFIY